MSASKRRRGPWLGAAIRQPGALRRTLGIAPGELIPRDELEAAARMPGKLGRRARAAISLRKVTRRRHR